MMVLPYQLYDEIYVDALVVLRTTRYWYIWWNKCTNLPSLGWWLDDIAAHRSLWHIATISAALLWVSPSLYIGVSEAAIQIDEIYSILDLAISRS